MICFTVFVEASSPTIKKEAVIILEDIAMAGSEPVQPPKVEKEKKPRRLLSLQYNISDSEDEETREERKARIVSVLATAEGGWEHIYSVCVRWGE